MLSMSAWSLARPLRRTSPARMHRAERKGRSSVVMRILVISVPTSSTFDPAPGFPLLYTRNASRDALGHSCPEALPDHKIRRRCTTSDAPPSEMLRACSRCRI